jgi:glycosyltransferase involved in cell wall biosynthesis
MKLSIIVPTYNSAENLKVFFDALIASVYKDFEVIINDDLRTDDNTKVVVENFIKKGLNIQYKTENKKMAQARKQGAKYAKGEYLIHLDSDMAVTKELLGEVISLMDKKTYQALVIPEEAYGTTFWARCKWLEKKMYIGVEQIESLRVISKENYEKLGGHDESMVFSEDKDFDLRVREANLNVGHTKNFLRHNEGDLRLLKTSKKKMGYSNTANIFAQKHPNHYRWQINILNRYFLFLKRFHFFFSYPLLYIGLFIMKTVEFGSGAIGLFKKKFH